MHSMVHLAHHDTPRTPQYTSHTTTHHDTQQHTTWCCTPCRGVHFSQISLHRHVTTHLSQSEGSILSNLSDLVRNCEISPKNFPPFKEQSCYNSSAKNWLGLTHFQIAKGPTNSHLIFLLPVFNMLWPGKYR